MNQAAIDPTSRPLLERAVASLGGEQAREAVMIVYRLGVVDGTLAGMDRAIERIKQPAPAVELLASLLPTLPGGEAAVADQSVSA